MTLQKKAFLLINGKSPKQLPKMTDYDVIAVTDGAYHYLVNHNIRPHFVSGDFDSITEIPTDIPVVHTPDQNDTDFGKVLKILKNKGVTEVDVYGASGQEQDHFLGNIHTALVWKNDVEIRFFDDYGAYFFAKPKSTYTNVLHKTISLLPIPEVTNVVTEGLQYPLDKEKLTFGHRIGTRNKAILDTITITFEKGDLLLFIQK